MEPKDEHTLYGRWISGKLTEQERTELEASGDLAKLERITAEIDTWGLPPVKTTYDDLVSKRNGTRKKKTDDADTGRVFSLTRRLGIAASVVLLIGAALGIYGVFLNGTEYTTVAGETKSVTLPDGSKVTLSGNSSLSFSNWGWEEDRKVSAQGQVYFEVTKKGPFEVTFANGTVNVLGTKFTVLSHQGTDVVECFEGKVRVNSENEEHVLLAGDAIRLKANATDVPYEVSTSPDLSPDGNFVFNNTPAEEVASVLELHYGISFENLPADFSTKTIGGPVSKSNLDDALDNVFGQLGITYTVNGKTVIIE